MRPYQVALNLTTIEQKNHPLLPGYASTLLIKRTSTLLKQEQIKNQQRVSEHRSTDSALWSSCYRPKTSCIDVPTWAGAQALRPRSEGLLGLRMLSSLIYLPHLQNWCSTQLPLLLQKGSHSHFHTIFPNSKGFGVPFSSKVIHQNLRDALAWGFLHLF